MADCGSRWPLWNVIVVLACVSFAMIMCRPMRTHQYHRPSPNLVSIHVWECLMNLREAMSCYYEEERRLLPGWRESDSDVALDHSLLLRALCPSGPGQKPYGSFGGSDGYGKLIQGDELVDSWGNRVEIWVDGDRDGRIVIGGTVIERKVAVWSVGENGINEYGDHREGDDLRAWPRPERELYEDQPSANGPDRSGWREQ